MSPSSVCTRTRTGFPCACSDTARPAPATIANRVLNALRLVMFIDCEESATETQRHGEDTSFLKNEIVLPKNRFFSVSPCLRGLFIQNRYVVANWNCLPGYTLDPPVCWPNRGFPTNPM